MNTEEKTNHHALTAKASSASHSQEAHCIRAVTELLQGMSLLPWRPPKLPPFSALISQVQGASPPSCPPADCRPPAAAAVAAAKASKSPHGPAGRFHINRDFGERCIAVFLKATNLGSRSAGETPQHGKLPLESQRFWKDLF